MKKLFAFFPFIGIIMFAVAEGVQFTANSSQPWRAITVSNAVVYLIGAPAFGGGIAHMFYGPPIAESIGWQPSPFQWEVGGANLGLGIAGVMASSFDRDYWLAVIIVAMGFLWVAGIGHIREIVKQHNYAVSNAGPILFTDFLIPAFCLAAWLAWA